VKRELGKGLGGDKRRKTELKREGKEGVGD